MCRPQRPISPLWFTALVWRFFGLGLVLVLSLGVIVIVIDLTIILNLDAFGLHEYTLNCGTLQSWTASDVQESDLEFWDFWPGSLRTFDS